MKYYIDRADALLLGAIFLVGVVFAGCSSQKRDVRARQGAMDTPEYHVSRGDDAMEQRRYQSAHSSYRHALDLDESHAPALTGKAVADAYLSARSGVSSEDRQKVLDQAEKAIEKAFDSADSKDNAALVRIHIAAIQVYFVLQMPEEDWYNKVREHYEEAAELAPNDPTLYYFMGRAESGNRNYEKAVSLFRRVLDIGGKYEAEAGRELKRIQRLQRALPGSRFGKNVADIQEITRAEIAALFIAELRLDRLYEDRKATLSGTTYETPVAQRKMKTESLQRYPEATDIAGHPMENTIQEVMQLKIKGLEANPAHKFFPEKKITRAEFAMMIQDILIKVTRDDGAATRYIGQPSPFPDVEEGVWYYNSVRTVVDRGLMSANNAVTGDFEPMASVSGADALLAIRTMKEILKKYLR